MEDRASLERNTGQLFGDLWAQYDAKLFEESVDLFDKRLQRARFDANWFKGKICLDAGCGGGRNSIAMARLGAKRVVGIDVGEEGLADAEQRSRDLPNVEFQYGSILDIPFPDETFDMVWCAGVLMITANDERALDELTRVTKTGGYLYLLVYATGGLRWPLIQSLRPLASQIDKPAIDRAIQIAGLSANKRRSFLDDLFCPRLDFFHWHRLERMLKERGFREIQRWNTECRLDHEADLESYRKDLQALLALFIAGENHDFGEHRNLFSAGRSAIEATIDSIRWFEEAVQRKDMPVEAAMNRVIGQGHHRVLAVRG
jgi:ubiquinone/menaquinone biosynthesis C-methylase UbiE